MNKSPMGDIADQELTKLTLTNQQPNEMDTLLSNQKFLKNILDAIKAQLTQKHSLARIFKLVSFEYGSNASIKLKKYQDVLTKITETRKCFKAQLIQKLKFETSIFNEYQIKFTKLH